jgi:hypothetical protein
MRPARARHWRAKSDANTAANATVKFGIPLASHCFYGTINRRG